MKLSESAKEYMREAIRDLPKEDMADLLCDFALYEVRTTADGDDGITRAIEYVSHVKKSILAKVKENEKKKNRRQR